MFEDSEKREFNKMKFNAAIHGVDIDKKKNKKDLIFPHPDEFKDLSDEEKQKITKTQMANHRVILPEQMR